MKSFILFLATVMTLAACDGGNQASTFVTQPSSGTGDSGGTGGTISSAGIFITMIDQTQAIPTYLHQFYNFNLPCSIAANAASTDMQCLLNVEELDLFEQGLKMEFNVAPGMCDYVSDVPYWFYNKEPGYGASQVVFNYNDGGGSTCTAKNASGVALTTTISGTTCSFNGGSVDNTGAVTCAYNHTGETPAGPNCCEGSYVVTGSSSVSGTATPINTSGTYGGLVISCSAGPYLGTSSGWLYNTTTGRPMEQIRTGTVGFNQYYKVVAPITLAAADNTYGANFWDWTSYSAGALTTTSLPKAMGYKTDSAGNNFPKVNIPNPAYVFNCYDKAMEVKHRIRLYINNWDTYAAFNSYGSSSGVTTNHPTTTGNCDVTNGPCHDISDWTDYETGGLYANKFPNLDLSALSSNNPTGQ